MLDKSSDKTSSGSLGMQYTDQGGQELITLCYHFSRDFKDTSKSKFAIAECAKFLTNTVFCLPKKAEVLWKDFFKSQTNLI